MIISAPGTRAAGGKTDELAELLDLYPTLCDLAGIDTPDFVDGSSLMPILNDVNTPVHKGAVNQYYRRLDDAEFMGYSIRSNEYRLVEWRDFATGEVTAKELYDHRTDHSETENIIESVEARVVDELTAELLKTHPRKRLVMTPAVHSNPNPGRWKADITFSNQTAGEITVHAITPGGRRGKPNNLKRTKQVTIKAKIGGVYVVESSDGKIHEIHSPSMPTRTVVVSEK